MRFPIVSGKNLLRENKQLPGDFEGILNVILIAFEQYQQYDVETWLPVLSDLESRFPGLQHYELPTISSRGRLAQWWIDEAMRAGIPNAEIREHTITLYLDKTAFREALEIDNERLIVVLLLDSQGNILWRCRGRWDAENGQMLQDQIQEHFAKL
jgi:hypothetical protein